MKYIDLATNMWDVSAIGVGCMRFASKSTDEVEKIIRTALDSGINFFDHADIYGGGKSEELFGEVLKRNPDLRYKMFIQSKCGINKGMYDFSKEHIIESVEGILERLQISYLDSLLLHRPDVLADPEEIREAFDQLYRSGKVRNFGVSNMNSFQIELLQKHMPYKLFADQLQLSLAHSRLIDEGLCVNTDWDNGTVRNSGTLEYLHLKGITLQAWSPLQFGMFRGTFLDNEEFSELNEKLSELAEKYNVKKDSIAYSWILRLPQNVQVITGTGNPEHIKSAAAGADVTLTRREWYDLYKAAGNKLP